MESLAEQSWQRTKQAAYTWACFDTPSKGILLSYLGGKNMAAPLLPLAGALFIAARLSRSWARHRRQEEILKEYRAVLEVPVDRAVQLRDALIQQMERGLAEFNSKEGLMMLPSYVDILPTGDEQGEFFAIDLGGTNLRVLYVKLGEGRGSTDSSFIREWIIPEDCFNVDNGKLLDWVADCTIEVLKEHHRSDSSPVIGFCFSFPVHMTALDNGKVLQWTKSFRGKALLGEDVVAALKASFEKKGVHVQIPAILNDTVSTLIALRYSEPDTVMGIILGTGTNCAYLERIDRIPKLPKGYSGRSSEMIINTEWGDFKGASLPTLPEDLWVDLSSVNPGTGQFEKLISGLYMGETARRLILRFAQEGHLFGSTAPEGLSKHGSLTSPMLSTIVEDESSDLEATGACMGEAFGMRGTSLHQRQKVREVCILVTQRAARLVACAIAAVLQHTGRGCRDGRSPPQHTVIAVDGSVFKKFGRFRELLKAGLVDICGQATADSVELRLQEDGSVFGSAYLAAAAAS